MTRAARLLRRARAAARRTRPVTFTAPTGDPIRWRRDDRYPEAMADGTYEEDCVALLRGLLRDGHTFLDLGANAGYVSLVAKALVGDGRVVAVEPHPENLTTLADRRRLNPDLPIEVRGAAVAARSGNVDLSLTHNLANARLTDAGWAHAKEPIGRVAVDAWSLDDLVRDVRPDVVKVDVEGAEGPILAAAAGPSDWDGLRPTFVIEYHGDENLVACRDAGARWGYRPEVRHREVDGLPVGLVVLTPEPA